MTENFFVKGLGEDHGQLRSGKINDYLGNPGSLPNYRVSIDRQGKSGLGVEAQQQTVWDFPKDASWRAVKGFYDAGQDCA